MKTNSDRPSFGIYHRLESVIIFVMIGVAILTYSIALLNNYSLYLSDYIGMAGLMVITVVSKAKKELTFYFLFILLFVGMLNLATFVYFFNPIIAFGLFGEILTPGIQFYSFILFFILVLFRKPKIVSIYQRIVGDTEEGRKKSSEQTMDYYKKRFEALPTEEVKRRLSKGLSPEAQQALNDILAEREGNK